MSNQLDDIKKINVNGKDYYITILKLGSKEFNFWYTAYVYLDKANVKNLENETYQYENIYGIDTAHSWNNNQSMKEKLEDAIRQITGLIKSYQERITK